MKKYLALLLTMALIISAVVITASVAAADEPISQSKGAFKFGDTALALDGTWVILIETMTAPAFFTGGPWTWSESAEVEFTITDFQVVSDQFKVYDNGVLVTTTPAMPDWDDLGLASRLISPPYTEDPDTALADGRFSSAVLYFGPGSHSITIEDIHIPPYAAGIPCSDGTVAFKAEIVRTVGGAAFPVDKTSVIAPWIAIALAIIAGGAYLIRNRAHSYK